MKILLGHGYFLNEDAVEKKIMRPYPPLGLLYISSYLDHMGIKNSVFDSTFSSKIELYEFLIANNPDYLGLYVNFLTRKNILEVIRFVRKSELKTKVILGGPDVRYHAENYLKNGADFLVIGEGEQTLYELLSSNDNTKINEINGLAFLNEKNEVVFTKERDFIKDLDTLPFPNREKIDLTDYLVVWKDHHGYSSITINAQRGCPYTCKWCSHAVYGDTYRRRSPKNVVEELVLIQKEYNPDSFWFVDDVFTMSKKWILDFQKELENKKLQISYECITRADKLDEEIITILKETGCKILWVGAESGSQKVLDLMDRKTDVRHFREMLKLAKMHGIKTGTFLMLGYPGETVDDINESIKHLKDCDPDYFTINKAYPIKGTALFDDVQDLIFEDYNWESTPDRDIDFKRTYSKKYYDFAIRKVYNEFYTFKSKNQKQLSDLIKFKAKSVAATIGMALSK